MDYLDIATGKFFQTFTGVYFEEMPEAILNTTDLEQLYRHSAGTPFDYEYISPTEYRYRNLIGNLAETEAADATVKTVCPLPSRVGSYVLLMDGRLCTVISVTQDASAASREAARMMPLPPGTEFILRLTARENPRGIR